jgi:hypothetical protein
VGTIHLYNWLTTRTAGGEGLQFAPDPQSVEGPYNFLIEAGLLNREYKSYPTESVPDNMQYDYIKAKYIAKHRFSLFYNYDVMGALRKTCWRRRGPWESFQEQTYP